jgi:NADH:ubiquinone oxidoreductase subunit K
LRSFHLFFIALSVILSAFVAAWATGQYRADHDMSYAAASVASIGAAIGLAVYANAFRRKTKEL